MESILMSIKEMLGIAPEYSPFDLQLTMHINSVFTILKQLGVGPSEGFSIKDATATWSDFMPDANRIEAVKSYTFMKVKMIFDNVGMSAAVISAYNEIIKELEWRILVEASQTESTGEEENQNE